MTLPFEKFIERGFSVKMVSSRLFISQDFRLRWEVTPSDLILGKRLGPIFNLHVNWQVVPPHDRYLH